jgi:hypothetical protein
VNPPRTPPHRLARMARLPRQLAHSRRAERELVHAVPRDDDERATPRDGACHGHGPLNAPQDADQLSPSTPGPRAPVAAATVQLFGGVRPPGAEGRWC